MLTGYTVYRAGLPASEAKADLPSRPSLDDLRNLLTPLLGTDRFEHVSVLVSGKAADMFVDEIGALKRLPRNEKAAGLYRAAYLDRFPRTDPETLPAIHGPAVVFDRPVWF